MSSLHLFILIVISSVKEGHLHLGCGVDPQNLTLLWGSDSELFCRRSCASCSGGNVFWTLNRRPLQDSSSTTINSTHTRLTLRNFSHRTATLECHCTQTGQVLGGIIIRAYARPDRLQCMWHYKPRSVGGTPELFTCSWRYQSPGEFNYTLVSRDSESGVELCPRSPMKTCTVDIVSGKVPLSPAKLVVRVQIKKWVAESELQEFHLYDHLKMIPPTVHVSVSSTHLQVEWTPWPRVRKPVHCQVTHEQDVQNVTVAPKQPGSLTLDDVDSCRNYTVSVRCAVGQSPWSDWSREVTVLSRLNKNKMDLRLWRRIGARGSDGLRDVLVMWKPIPVTCRGTFIFSLNWTSANLTTLEEACGNSSCEVRVDQNQHTLHLSVFDGAALLVEESVYVPESGGSAPQVRDLQTWVAEGSIGVSWRPPPEPVTGYMVDWTHDGTQYQWSRTSDLNVTLSDLLDLKAYTITVTPLLGERTGATTWSEPVCTRVGDPGLASILDVQALDTSAIVRWTVTAQECSDAINYYSVSYRTDSEPWLNVSVSHMQQEVVLEHLTPDTQYRVQIKANSLTGSSKISEWFFTTKKFDPRVIKVLSISGSIAFILVLSLGLICAVLWRKFKEKPVPDPRRSSLARWSSHDETRKGNAKDVFPRQPFYNPTESVCEQVYTEKPWDGDSQPTSASDPGEHSSTAMLLPEKMFSSSGESSTLLSTDSDSSNPYRSQNSVDVPVCKSKGKKSSVTTYVTLEMFEDDELRDRT